MTLCKFLLRHRVTKPISLHFVAADPHQKFFFLRRFHTFGDDAQFKACCHRDDGFDDGAITVIVRRLTNPSFEDLNAADQAMARFRAIFCI